MLGGIGPCGSPICCRTFLSDFTPVSIKMAKEQNLSLNPTKISGLCDRLMCCLKYEQDQYEATRKRMPRVGREIITPDGVGTINAINVLEETVRVRIAVGDSFELREYPIDDCQRPEQPNSPAGEKAEKQERSERREKPERAEKPEKGERREKPEKGEAQAKPEKHEKTEKGERPERGAKQKRQDRPERSEKPAKPEGSEQQGEKARKPRPEKQAKPQRNAEKPAAPQAEKAPASMPAAEADVLEIVEETVVEDLL